MAARETTKIDWVMWLAGMLAAEVMALPFNALTYGLLGSFFLILAGIQAKDKFGGQ